MELNDRAMKALLDAFDSSDWQEMTITVGSDTLHVSRQASGDGTAPAPAAAPAAPAAAPPTPAGGPDAQAAPPAATPGAEPAPAPVATDAAPAPPEAGAADRAPGTGARVESPSVGLFWRKPSPTSPPFVETGARVNAGDTVGIVEVMKLMNYVVAPVAGVVSSILVENGAAVEYGDTLMTIDPEG